MSYSEYESFANEWDEMVDCELIPNGVMKGLPIDYGCDMHPDHLIVFRAELEAAHYQRIEDEAIEAACKNRGCLSESYEDRWPEGAY